MFLLDKYFTFRLIRNHLQKKHLNGAFGKQ